MTRAQDFNFPARAAFYGDGFRASLQILPVVPDSDLTIAELLEPYGPEMAVMIPDMS